MRYIAHEIWASLSLRVAYAALIGSGLVIASLFLLLAK